MVKIEHQVRESNKPRLKIESKTEPPQSLVCGGK